MRTIEYINKNTPIFLIKSSDIEGRLDPYFYNSALQLFTSLKKFEIKKIHELVNSFISGFGAGKQDQANDEKGIIQIRPTNMDKYGQLIFDKNIFIPKSLLKSQKYLLEKGDVIFNNTNSQEWVGKTAYFNLNGDFSFSNHITVLKVNNKIIEPKYLWIILNIYQQKKIFFSICTNWNNQSGIGLDVLKQLKIPVPNLNYQRKIISIMESGLNTKAQKENQARELLSGIDVFVIKELGITKPEKDNSLQARIFSTSFQKLTGNRFDPKLYDMHSQNLFKAVSNAKFDKIPLKELISQSDSGDWGLDESEKVDKEEYTKCLVIRATEFDNLYNLKLENDRVRHRWIKNDKLYKLDIQPNDLLIEKSGGSPDQPVGRISILTKDLFESNELCFSNFIHKIRVIESKVFPEYLFCFLKTIHNIKITEIMQSQTNGIRNLIMREYFNQQIVLPPIEKQKEIATEANRRRFEAQQLEKEARETLERARQEIEQIILNP